MSLRAATLLVAAVPLLAGARQAAPTGGTASVTHYLAQMDADGDGRVSQAEYLDWMGYAFERMDRDHDGLLAAAEQPGGKGQPITRASHRAQLAERFRKQDANHDGQLDARELAAPPR